MYHNRCDDRLEQNVKLMKPPLNNSFTDPETGLRFIIPGDRQVTNAEATKLISDHIRDKKKELLEAWKKALTNRNWKGDEEQKTEDLFAKFVVRQKNLNSEILLMTKPAKRNPKR